VPPTVRRGRVRASVRGRDGPAGGDAHWSERGPSDACSPRRVRGRACVCGTCDGDAGCAQGLAHAVHTASAVAPALLAPCAQRRRSWRALSARTSMRRKDRQSVHFAASSSTSSTRSPLRPRPCALLLLLLLSSLCLTSATIAVRALYCAAASMGFKPTPAIRRCTRAPYKPLLPRAVPRAEDGGRRVETRWRGGRRERGRCGIVLSSRRRRCAR